MSQDNPQLEAPDDPANEQPLVAHLIELRNRLMKSVIAIIVVFACLSPFMKQIFDFLSQPLMVALPQGAKLLATGVVAPFFVPLKVTLFVAFLIALPVVLYQAWAYIAPALYRSEKRLAFPILISSIVMFAIGMAYCYFIVFRMVFQFIAGFSPDSVNFAPDIDSYFSFVLTMFLAFGMTFEVPIIVVVLNRVGIATYSKLTKARPYVIVGAFVLAAIFTPPDALSQILLALPLVILYQVGIWCVKIAGVSDEEVEELKEKRKKKWPKAFNLCAYQKHERRLTSVKRRFFITQDPDMSTPSIVDGGTSASFSKEPRGRLVGRIRLVSTRPERSIFTSTGVPGLSLAMICSS